MKPESDHKYFRIKKISVVIAVLLLTAGLFGWWLGSSNDSQNEKQSVNEEVKPTSNSGNVKGDVKNLVSYTLPNGFKEAFCQSQPGSVFVVMPSSGNVDCDANPSSPIKISVDPGNNKDCNQLQNVKNVSKHICISEFINGHKSLKAETIYNQDSPYKKETAVNAYYIDIGKSVIKLEYIRSNNDNNDQVSFENLAKSVQVK